MDRKKKIQIAVFIIGFPFVLRFSFGYIDARLHSHGLSYVLSIVVTIVVLLLVNKFIAAP